MIVTTRDIFTIPGFSKRRGFCRGGARNWFRAHDLDWSDFVKHGIEEEKLLAVGDAFAIATVKWARARAAATPGAMTHG